MPNFNPANWGITNAVQAMAGAGNNLQSSGGNKVNFSAPASSYSIAPVSNEPQWGDPGTYGAGSLGNIANNLVAPVAPVRTGPSAAEVAAKNAARSNINATESGYAGGARQSLTDVGNTYDQRTRGFVNELETGQGDINTGLAGNQLNLRQSMRGIVKGVQQGVRSGGVALAGMNASDSGAAEALARAYAQVGNNQTGEARGEAATVSEDLMRSQGQLDKKKNEGIGDLNTYRDTETGRVRSDFGNKLDLLTATAKGQGLGGEVDRGLVDQVLNEALTRLSQIDQSRNERLGGIKQWTPEEVMKEAMRREALGEAGNAFQVAGPEVSYGGGAQGMAGAPLGQMPIYMKGKDEQAIVPTKKDDAKV